MTDGFPAQTKATLGNSPAMWSDPDDSGVSGVLLSDRIRFYVDEIGLITPYLDSHLGPATYDLTLGPECWYADYVEQTGDPKRTLALRERLVLEPNSIVYVSSTEVLNLPFYLVGRFNLKLRLLHEGLLVGAGPQVDPGFSGKLSCPLHNISSSRISLVCGDPFAVIEFQKTTPFAQEEKWRGTETLSEMRARGESLQLKGIGGRPCLTFPARSINREPVKRYVPAGRLVTSSMQGLQSRQNHLEKNVASELDEFRNILRTINIISLVTIATIAITLGTYFWGVVNWNKSVNDNAVQAVEHMKTLESERSQLELRVQDLEREVNRLSSETKPEAPKAPPPGAKP